MGKQGLPESKGLEVSIQISVDLKLAAAVYSLPIFPRNNNTEKNYFLNFVCLGDPLYHQNKHIYICTCLSSLFKIINKIKMIKMQLGLELELNGRVLA